MGQSQNTATCRLEAEQTLNPSVQTSSWARVMVSQSVKHSSHVKKEKGREKEIDSFRSSNNSLWKAASSTLFMAF